MSPSSVLPPLFVLAVDHRFDLFSELLAADPARPGAANREQAAELKQIVFAGLLAAVEDRVPKSQAAIWTDADLGESVLLRARGMRLSTIMSVEQARAPEFRFEDAAGFPQHLERLGATCAGTRVRYDPAAGAEDNAGQCRKLRRLSEICRDSGLKLLVELTAPSSGARPARDGVGLGAGVEADAAAALEPSAVLQALQELQDAGVAPDQWVFEATPDAQVMAALAAQACVDGRESGTLFTVCNAGDQESADRLIELSARIPGVQGLVVGASAYREELAACQAGEMGRDEAAAGIAARYARVYEAFTRARSTSGVV